MLVSSISAEGPIADGFPKHGTKARAAEVALDDRQEVDGKRLDYHI